MKARKAYCMMEEGSRFMNANQGTDPGLTPLLRATDTATSRVAEAPPPKGSKEAAQSYAKLVHTIKDLVQITIPLQSMILVVSKGDDELVDLRGRCAWHFPRAVNGKFAGCYPVNSTEAIDHLEKLRAQGAEYFLIPSTSFWWLEFYTEFTQHLQRKYRIVTYQENACIVYSLNKDVTSAD